MDILRHCVGPDCHNFFSLKPSHAKLVLKDGITPERRYCSTPCANEGRKKLTAIVCEYCQTVFKLRPSAAKNRHYCSPKCQRFASQKRVDLICEECEMTFSAQLYEKDRRRFCSLECRLSGMRRDPFECQFCHKHFRDPNNPKIRKFCSNSCRAEFLRGTSYIISSNDKIEEIVIRYQSGESSPMIAKDFGCDTGTILKVLRDQKIKIRKHTTSGHRIKLPREEVIFFYEMGQSISHIAGIYHCRNALVRDRLTQWGIPIRGGKPHTSANMRCIDGHYVRSSAEQSVDNWLYAHGIAHIYEPSLPFKTQMRADFFANNHFIEIFGGHAIHGYKARMTEKISLYEVHNITLIRLTWKQTLRDLDTALAPLLMPSPQ